MKNFFKTKISIFKKLYIYTMFDYKKVLKKKLDFVWFMLHFNKSYTTPLSSFEVGVSQTGVERKRNEIHERGTTFKIESLLVMLEEDFEAWLKEKNVQTYKGKNTITFYRQSKNFNISILT